MITTVSECVARTSYEKVNQTDIDGLYEVYWADGQKFNLYNASMGGDLAGLIQMRDGNNGENFTGQVTATGTTTTADGKTHDTVTVKVTKAYLQDLNKCNLSDQEASWIWAIRNSTMIPGNIPANMMRTATPHTPIHLLYRTVRRIPGELPMTV